MFLTKTSSLLKKFLLWGVQSLKKYKIVKHMNILTLLALGVTFIFSVLGFFFCVRAYRASRREKIDSAQRQRAVIDDLGDGVLWEMGKDRPIIQTKGLELKITQRNFLQKLALGALVSFAGWTAARGENLIWAEKMAVDAKTGKIKANPQLGVENHVDQAAHTDTHSDSNSAHTDSHYDTTPHTDTPHNDGTYGELNQNHTDVDHSDTTSAHTDTHSDVDPVHTDTHSDAP
jgi:hypothetical protein